MNAFGAIALSMHAAPAGMVELAPTDAHVVSVHLSNAVRSRCRATGFRYLRRRGAIDVVPRGSVSAHEDDGPSTTLRIALAPRLVEGPLAVRHLVQDARIEHVALALAAEHAAGYSGGARLVESLGTALAVAVAAPPARPELPPEAAGLAPVFAAIDLELDGDLSVARLARLAGFSASRLKSTFRAVTGQSLHAYVMAQRVARAEALVTQQGMPLAQAALAAGFAHQSHLARWTRRLLGVTPRRLRKVS